MIIHYSQTKSKQNNQPHPNQSSLITTPIITHVIYHHRNKFNMDDRYAFTVEWYDVHAALIRKYQLLYYTTDGTCEMIDLKNKRLFLKKSKCPNVRISDLFVGSIVNILGRQLTIADYGDNFTRSKLQSKMERTLGIIKPDCVNKMGEVFKRIHSDGRLSVCNLRMITLSRKEADLFCKINETSSPIFDKMAVYISEGPIVVFELLGESAVGIWNELLGPLDPVTARKESPRSLRAQFGTDNIRNGFHGSLSIQTAETEINNFFGSNNIGKKTAVINNSTLGVIKPHAVKNGLVGDIIENITSFGLNISAIGMFNIEKANAEEFYEIYKGVVREYTQMVEELCSGPCVAIEITCDHKQPQQLFRDFVGPCDPEIARHLRPKTLRAIYGKDKVLNAIHCTDLPEDQTLEVEYFFKILY